MFTPVQATKNLNPCLGIEIIPVNEGYIDRLKAWVVEESQPDRAGSQNKLAERLGLRRSALVKWKKGDLKNGLDSKSIEAIAHYRHEDPAQTRAWLEGRSLPPDFPLIGAIEGASLPTLINAIKAIGYRLEALLEGKMGVSDFLMEWLSQCWHKSMAEFEEQVREASGQLLSAEQIRGIVRGVIQPTDDDLFFIGAVVVDPNGMPWSLDEWQQIRAGKLRPSLQVSERSERNTVS